MKPLLMKGLMALAIVATLPSCAVAQKVEVVSSLVMPPSADYGRLNKLRTEGRMTKVYVDMLRTADGADKAHFPPEMAQLVDITPLGLTRLFTDTILKSRRFEVYDLRSTVTAEQADVMIDAQIIAANQEFKPLEGGVQAAHTSVLLSVQMKDIYTGKYLLGTAVQVEGKTGLVSGDRAVLMPGESPSDPAIRNKLMIDYQRALRRAFVLAGQRIEGILRPQAVVTVVDGNDMAVLGGQQHGFQDGDELIVFRSKLITVGDSEKFGLTKPIALVRCTGVGTETSQCAIVRKLADFQPDANDFAIITDASLRKTRWE